MTGGGRDSHWAICIAVAATIAICGVGYWKATRSKSAVMHGMLSSLNHKPVALYAHVLDQDDHPVQGAEVLGELQYNTGLTMGMTKIKAITDQKGYLKFSGLHGATLNFTIIKQGYRFTPEGEGFEYSHILPPEKRHHPDPANPIVLKMWKLQGAQPLLYGVKTVFMAPDGVEVRVDLQTGQVVESGGDLIFSLKYDLQPTGAFPKVPYNWSASITMVNGGLLEVNQRIENMLQAPDGDYKTSFVIDSPASKPKWQKQFALNFYAKIRGNRFARLQFNGQCIPTQPKGFMQAIWWLNPSGSRNLEYDPKLRIEPK